MKVFEITIQNDVENTLVIIAANDEKNAIDTLLNTPGEDGERWAEMADDFTFKTNGVTIKELTKLTFTFIDNIPAIISKQTYLFW